MRKILI